MGEMAKAEGGAAQVSRGAIHIVRSLGLLGLYQGATACLARDVPFVSRRRRSVLKSAAKPCLLFAVGDLLYGLRTSQGETLRVLLNDRTPR